MLQSSIINLWTWNSASFLVETKKLASDSLMQSLSLICEKNSLLPFKLAKVGSGVSKARAQLSIYF